MNDMEGIKAESIEQDVRPDASHGVRHDVRGEDVRHPLRMGKNERLHHRTLVEGLFAEGKSMYEFPLRMVWRWMPTGNCLLRC